MMLQMVLIQVAIDPHSQQLCSFNFVFDNDPGLLLLDWRLDGHIAFHINHLPLLLHVPSALFVSPPLLLLLHLRLR